MKKSFLLTTFLFIACCTFDVSTALCQHKKPSFEDYPVEDVYKGKPSPVKLDNPSARMFRTMIREGAKTGPNFAGSYTIVEWGCGSACISAAIVDATTGKIYDPPFDILGFAYIKGEPLRYRLSSRLLIVNGCPEDKNCGTYYYKWDKNRLIRLKHIKKDSSGDFGTH